LFWEVRHVSTEFVARPTIYNGVRMRSRTEATFAAFLDRHGFDWQYEPEAFAGAGGQYLPDFRVSGGPRRVYFEVNGPPLDERKREDRLRRMSVLFRSDPEAVGVLIEAGASEMLYRVTDIGDLDTTGSAPRLLGWYGFGACPCGWLSFVRVSEWEGHPDTRLVRSKCVVCGAGPLELRDPLRWRG
jgi:hypothetical protein